MSKQHEELMSENYAFKEPPADSRLIDPKQAKNSDIFVSAQWLKEKIDEQADRFVLLDVTRGQGDYKLDVTRVDKDYEKSHIPTAIHFSTDELGEFKDYLKDVDQLKEAFLSKGINKDSSVVLYSAYARDIMYIASRVAFAAYYLGVDDIKILDGGMQAWERAGYALENGHNTPEAVKPSGAELALRPHIYIKTPADLIEELDRHPDTVLASVRSWNEFLGKNQGHEWNKGVGEIAGAVYAGDDYLTNVNGEMANPEEYLDQWASWGITADADIILYCGTSWRSSTAFFLMKHLGWENVKMFDGSWFKYNQAHQENPEKFPIQRGNPKDADDFEIIPHPSAKN